ncbi:hypothetical protein GA0070609_2629 [Micromonospora echinaurantiaca]|uniref:DUF3558 domain-containing protein n=1 Tax=Micromonospora echinaurantiaca TaxID=47857 RepID=A0A1C5I2P5_9ACTN|nr:hypothetical protein [Micromonospora echinaurantiaca]SCG52171.1 hypothetical protein GA0070609_2629 [Micromonospora echinaurantiaca]
MRRWIAPVALVVVLALTGCGGSEEPQGSPGAAEEVDGGDGVIEGDGAAVERPSCPFTPERASELVGRTMNADGNCLFRDGNGVAILTITLASEVAGQATYDYSREQAGKRFERVSEVDKGDQGYLATGGTEAEAVVISKAGAYTVQISSFHDDAAANEALLRKLVDAIPA